MHSVAVIVFPGVQALDVCGPMDVFAEANSLLNDGDGYEVTLIGPSCHPLKASNGMTISADLSFSEAEGPYDLLLVAGGPSLSTSEPDYQMVDCIRRLAKASQLVGSICTGAFCLGQAGLLDGKKTTTHWQDAALLAEKFPNTQVDYDRIYLRDGDLITSAGVTAGIDLALALVREDYGTKISLSIAKRLVVVAQRQGGQSQFSPYVGIEANDSPISEIIAYVMDNLCSKLTVADLAQKASMSTRSFARAFLEHAKITPGEFVERARIDAARNDLESREKPLKVVAHDCGFGTPRRLRQAFTKRLGLSPVQYRERFSV